MRTSAAAAVAAAEDWRFHFISLLTLRSGTVFYLNPVWRPPLMDQRSNGQLVFGLRQSQLKLFKFYEPRRLFLARLRSPCPTRPNVLVCVHT